MVMEIDNKVGSIGKTSKSHKVGVGGRAYPEQIGKSCTQQKPGESEKKDSGFMKWGGHHSSHHKKDYV